MKLAFSYKRWSTKSQTDKDSSIRQANSANAWMKEHGTALGYVLSSEKFTDDGKSGYKGKHIAKDDNGVAKGELMRFIQRVESGNIPTDSILLIDEISRFSRLPLSEAVPLFMHVINSGIGLVFTGGYDKRIITKELINNDSYLLPSIVTDLFRMNRESVEKGRKIKAAKQTMLEDIKKGVVYRNNLPKYFSFVSDVPSNPKCRTGKYVHNKLTEVLKELIGMFVAGKAMYSIAATLNHRKVKTFKGSEWSGNGINKILRNRILMGEYKGVKNYVEPIISDREFDKIQAMLDRNVFNKGKAGELINIFRGVCFCSECGSAMSIMSTKFNGESYKYLRCSSITRGKIGCSNRKSLPLPAMEFEFFYNFLCKNPKQLIDETESRELKELKSHIHKNELKLTSLTSNINKLIELSDTVDIAELKTQLGKLNKERDGVKQTIDDLGVRISNVEDAPDTYVNLRKLILDTADSQSAFNDLVMADSFTAEEWSKTSSANKKNFTQLQRAKEQIVQSLQDNYAREGIRIMLPPLIGKITVDGSKGQFYVFNRMNKMIFQSTPHIREYNSSDKWVKGVKDYWARKNSQKTK